MTTIFTARKNIKKMNISAKITGVDSVLKDLNINQHRAIVKGATNTGGSKAFTQARRAAKREYNLQATIGSIPFTKEKASAYDLTYRIATITRMYNIAAMFRGIKQTGAGVKAEIRKGHKTVIKGAFIARPSGKDYSAQGQKRKVTSGKDLVLQRAGSRSYPLEGIGNKAPKGISWAMILLNSTVKRTIGSTFATEYEKNFGIRLEKMLAKKV